jgi:hypothetical protein
MSGTIDPPKAILQYITKYTYSLTNLIPHTSVSYAINCYNENAYVLTITGILEGEQYKEWTTDEWLDRFIKQKVEELPYIPVTPAPPTPPAPEPTFTEV